MRIADGGGSTRPADTIILLEGLNILAEYKRTDGDEFKLSMLEEGQKVGLVDFEGTEITINAGMVFVSFYNEEVGRDECYGFRLIPALQYMVKHKRVSIGLEVIRAGGIPAVKFDLVDDVNRTWDLGNIYEVR